MKGRLVVRSGVAATVLLDIPGSTPGDGFGVVVSSPGDVDGDGNHDLVVAANSYVRGISGATGSVLWQVPEAGVISIAPAPDLDGDGASDWACGAPSGQFAVVGSVHLRSGRTGNLLSTIVPPVGASSYFGYSLASAGDFDFDGNADLIVGDPEGGTGYGSVSVYGMVQPSMLANFQGVSTGFPYALTNWFGASVATPGDIDGDGVPELLVGAPAEPVTAPPLPGQYEGGGPRGRVRLLSGATGTELLNIPTTGGFGFGVQVAAYPDLDGDGKPELLMSTQVIIAGCCHYLPADLDIYSSVTGQPLFWLQGIGAPSVAVIRDFNGDGFAELLSAQSGWAANATRMILPFAVPVNPSPGCVPKLNSLGCLSRTDYSGWPSLTTGDDLRLTGSGLKSGTLGMFLLGSQPATLPFFGGMLCVGGTIRRSAVLSTGPLTSYCSGAMQLDVPKPALAALGVPIGSTLYVQAWYRDTGFSPPNDVGLGSGIGLTILP
ncbi:MAG: integrin alpha [Planctomycetota bacterium]